MRWYRVWNTALGCSITIAIGTVMVLSAWAFVEVSGAGDWIRRSL